MAEHYVPIRVEIDDLEQLQRLVGPGDEFPASSIEGLIEYLVRSVADGVRRPGSWERTVVIQLTGALL